MTNPTWLLQAEEARRVFETRLLKLPIVTEGARGPYNQEEFDRFCRQAGTGIIALFSRLLRTLRTRVPEGSEVAHYLERNRRQEEIHFRGWCQMAKRDASIERDEFPRVILSPEMVALGTHVTWLSEDGPLSLAMAAIFLTIEPLAFKMTEAVALTQGNLLKAPYWMNVHTRSQNGEFASHYRDACRFIGDFVTEEQTHGRILGTVRCTGELLEHALASAYRAQEITSNSGG